MYWSLRAKIFVLAVCLVWGLSVGLAQEPTPSEPAFMIHVVQRDETLSQIAQQHGTTLEALTQMNGLLDPDRLQIGQRIIIPNSRRPTAGMVVNHIVEAGETLETLARRYNSTALSLAQTNQIFQSDSLYLGQNVLVTVGSEGALPPETYSAHRVQVGDTWLRLALRYNLPLLDLLSANERSLYDPLQLDDLLIIPQTALGERFVQLPAPIADLQIQPLPAEQGRSISVYLEAPANSTVTGRIFDRDYRFNPNGAGYYAMIGIHSFTEPALYPLTVTITAPDGQQATYETRIQIVGGGYGQEVIDIPPERQGLLEASVIQGELERIQTLMSGFTDTKYFSGLMNLPSTGRITSQYGTRRSYNGSPYDTFHGGADFGGAEGTLVTAPADGMVILAEPLNVRGNTVIIDHGWGVYTGYWHNTELFVTVGQPVKRGDVISTIGATGLVTGAHLHWEMWVGGVQVDPLQWVTHAFDDFAPKTPEPDLVSFPEG